GTASGVTHDYLPRRYRPSQHGDHGRSRTKTRRHATRQLRNHLVAQVPASQEEPGLPDPKSERGNARHKLASRRTRTPGGAEGLVVPDSFFDPLPEELERRFR